MGPLSLKIDASPLFSAGAFYRIAERVRQLFLPEPREI
jgi:hypothetical protein